MSRPPGEGEWTTVPGEVVIDTKQAKGKVVLGEGVAPSLTKGRAVFRLAKDGKEVQCQLARGQEVGRVRVSQADAEVLDLGANVCSSQVRRRRFDDGLRNLRSLSLLVAAVPALAAVL